MHTHGGKATWGGHRQKVAVSKPKREASDPQPAVAPSWVFSHWDGEKTISVGEGTQAVVFGCGGRDDSPTAHVS